MYNTNLVKISKMKSGRLGIETPYNGEFVRELKAMVPSARWQSPYWLIDPISQDEAEKLLAKYYPSEETFQTVRITWNLNRDNPQIDGINLASIDRDYWSWRRNCSVSFKVIEQEIESGGSRKHPGLFGKLIIETQIRPGAAISPEPDEFEVLEGGEAPNPLADFSDEDLLAELVRRGLK